MSFAWNPNLITEVATYLKQGLSAAQIASVIGTSKNAVVSKVHRSAELRAIGLGGNGTKSQKGLNAKIAKRAHTTPKPPRLKVVKPTMGFEPAPQVAGKTLLLLNANDCKWPVNDADVGEDHLFCGIDAGSGHYCAHHSARLYVRRAAA